MDALSDVTVVDISVTLPGPYASKLLALLGADVLSIEPPGGDLLRTRGPTDADGTSELYAMLNEGKRVMTADLKTEAGRAFLVEVVAHADVFIEGFRPGAVEDMGLGPDALRARNGDLVYCSLSGFGQDGPRSEQPGHSINYEALAGLLAPEHPSMPRLPVADFAGATLLALGIVSALRARDRGGVGCRLDLGLFEAVAAWNFWHAPWATDPASPTDYDPLVGGEYPCYNVYETADGRFLTLGIVEESFWETLCTDLGLPELVDRQFERGGTDGEAYRVLQRRFEQRPLDDWVERLSADLPVAPVRTSAQALRDPQAAARAHLPSIGSDGDQPPSSLGFPVHFGPTEPEPAGDDPTDADPADGIDDLLARAGVAPEAVEAVTDHGYLGRD